MHTAITTLQATCAALAWASAAFFVGPVGAQPASQSQAQPQQPQAHAEVQTGLHTQTQAQSHTQTQTSPVAQPQQATSQPALRTDPAPKPHSVQPELGMVPDEATAVAIALAVWRPIYGEQHIARKAPFHARLADGEWTVEGSLPPHTKGGVPLAVIAQRDGRILRISHGK